MGFDPSPQARSAAEALKWVIERPEDTVAAVETPIGRSPTPESLDIDGLDMSAEDIATCLKVEAEGWKAERSQIEEWFAKFGDQLPTTLHTERDNLKARLGVHKRLGC